MNNVGDSRIYIPFRHLLRFIDYWDSYWIIEGLIQSQLFYIAKDTLENFMDEIERFGFIPNGGRIYCNVPLHAPHSKH